jgi:hypothetical protein
MKIIDQRTQQEPKEEYRVGDCVEIVDQVSTYLCIIAQTSSGVAKLIGLTDGNRAGLRQQHSN